MTGITTFSRTQQLVLNPASGAVSVVNAGPQGPEGVGATTLEPRVEDLEDLSVTQGSDISALEAVTTTHGSDITDLQGLWAPNGVDHITGPVVKHPGPVFTNHDAMYWYNQMFEGNATYVPNGATIHAPAYWSFADSATQWIKWLWAPGDAWAAYDIRFGVLLPGFVASNTSRWRYSEERFTINTPSPSGTMINTPVEVASVTVPAIEAVGQGNFYGNIAVDVPWTSPFELVLSTIERVPAHAEDLQVGGLGVYIVTATRTDG